MLGGDVNEVVVGLVTMGSAEAIKAGVKMFRERFKRAEVTVEDEGTAEHEE